MSMVFMVRVYLSMNAIRAPLVLVSVAVRHLVTRKYSESSITPPLQSIAAAKSGPIDKTINAIGISCSRFLSRIRCPAITVPSCKTGTVEIQGGLLRFLLAGHSLLHFPCIKQGDSKGTKGGQKGDKADTIKGTDRTPPFRGVRVPLVIGVSVHSSHSEGI